MNYLNGDYGADHGQGYCGWSYQKRLQWKCSMKLSREHVSGPSWYQMVWPYWRMRPDKKNIL